MAADARFIDSNVIVYLASADARKAAIAEQILREGGIVSVQVLNEVANVLRRKAAMDLDDVSGFLTMVRAFVRVTPVTLAIHEHGLGIARQHRLSIYDAMIVAAAASAGATILVSEDMADGAVLAGVRITDPFAPQ